MALRTLVGILTALCVFFVGQPPLALLRLTLVHAYGPQPPPGTRSRRPLNTQQSHPLPSAEQPKTAASNQALFEKYGSRTPDVYFEELHWPLRDNVPISCAFLSPHDPDGVMAVSNEGHAWRSDDGGRTWDEVRAIVAPQSSFFGDVLQAGFFGKPGQAAYYGALRRSPSPAAMSFRGPARPHTPTGLGGVPTVGLDLWNMGTPHHPTQEVRADLLIDEVSRFGRTPRGGIPGDQYTLPYMNVVNHLPTSRKELIALKAQRNPDIWFPLYHPYDPNITWLVTYYGLFTSYNGGRDYFRTFIGTSVQGREVFEVMVDPHRRNRVWLSTGEGSYLSTDGGRNYMRHTGKGIGDWITFGYWWHPVEKDVMFATTDHALMRSKDNGDNWEIIYYTAYRPARTARNLSIDPFNPNIAILNTFDGAFITDDIVHGGVESWRRFAPLQFTGTTYLRGVTHCPLHKGHIYSVANLRLPTVDERGTFITGHSYLWETLDYGKSWRAVYSSNQYGRITWAIQDPWDPHLFLIATDRALVRMRRRSPDDPPPRQVIDVPSDPPITDVVQAALRSTLTAPDLLMNYRSRARFRSLMPSVELSYRQQRWTYLDLVQDGRYLALPFRRWDRLTVPAQEFRVLLLWNLNDLVFNKQQYFSDLRREYRILRQLRDQVILEIHQAYGRLRQLRVQLANLPPERRRQRLHYRVRIQEATALINFLTNDYLAKWHDSSN